MLIPCIIWRLPAKNLPKAVFRRDESHGKLKSAALLVQSSSMVAGSAGTMASMSLRSRWRFSLEDAQHVVIW